eukprot:TRINITY_DN10671_c0_g1_i2.p1 TRINITY_DN10671_c0_g1~~TRINITY_DN10671_c0_g1_i2.p1  ORF type:complete len:493 (+),score=84.84 TRINITY_DN10671_c0_g1_i2:69-1481(+)
MSMYRPPVGVPASRATVPAQASVPYAGAPRYITPSQFAAGTGQAYVPAPQFTAPASGYRAAQPVIQQAGIQRPVSHPVTVVQSVGQQTAVQRPVGQQVAQVAAGVTVAAAAATRTYTTVAAGSSPTSRTPTAHSVIQVRPSRAVAPATRLSASVVESAPLSTPSTSGERVAAVAKTYSVQMLGEEKEVVVTGPLMGDLRDAIRQEFGIPGFEQTIMYAQQAGGEPEQLTGDDSLPLREKKGLLDAKELLLVRQVDPRFKMEKETAFLQALVACRFLEAKDILESSGVTIDPNCVHRGNVSGRVAVTECPCSYRHPALTVAMQAGLEDAVTPIFCKPEKIQRYMAFESDVCQVVEKLIDMNADVNATGDEVQDCESAGAPEVHGKTPLCAAVQRGSRKLVRMLLDAKADPNAHMTYGSAAYGPDKGNPFGPGNLRPESWLGDITNGSVGRRDAKDPRTQFEKEILAMLHAP